MPLTPEDVQNKRFSTVRFKEGYDEEEVDAFLDEVEAELRRLLGENTDLRTRAPAAPAAAPTAAAPVAAAPAAPVAAAPAAPAEEPSEAALRTLLLAQRTADEAIAQAKQEAEQIVASAKVRASSIESEAQTQHAQAMADLQRQRTTLEAAIDELRAFEREYRTRLKAYLEGQLRDLDTRGTAAPGQAPAAAVPSSPPPPPSSAAAPSAPAAPATPPAAAGGQPPGVPRLAPPAGAGGAGAGGAGAGAAGAPRPPTPSPFSAAPPLVEDVDAGSDAPGGPPREAEADTEDTGTPGGSPS